MDRNYLYSGNLLVGTAQVTNALDNTLISAKGAGQRIYVSALSVANTGSTATVVVLKDGSSTIWQTIAPCGGGSNMTFPHPLRLSDNSPLSVTSSVANSTVFVSVSGYQTT